MKFDVITFGEALVDRFPDRSVVGGAPFNVARHLAGLGLAPLMITRFGDDTNAARIMAEFERFAMMPLGVQRDPNTPTGVVDVTETGPGQHQFHIVADRAWDHIDGLAARAVAETSRDALLYFGSLAQRAPDSRAALTSVLTHHTGTTFLDLNWRDAQISASYARKLLETASVIKLNHEELQRALGWYDLDPKPVSERPPAAKVLPVMAAFMSHLSAKLLLVTWGADGYAAFDTHGVCLVSGPAAKITRLVDTVGAGDAFAAVTIAGLVRNLPLALTLEHAARFAAAICGTRGATPEDLAFYTPWRVALMAGRPPSRT